MAQVLVYHIILCLLIYKILRIETGKILRLQFYTANDMIGYAGLTILVIYTQTVTRYYI